ncbi:MAG: hypothetical protein ACR2NP_07235 [Pirellulaceae bacterium]
MNNLRVRCVVLGVLSMFAGMYIAEAIPSGHEPTATHRDSYTSSVANDETQPRTSVAVATRVEDDTPVPGAGIEPAVRHPRAIQPEPSPMSVATR